jgi:hypothetical protein
VNGLVQLTWTNHDAAVLHYQLQRAEEGPFENIGPTLPPTVVTVMDTTARPGVRYRYRLTGTGTGRACGEMGYSNEVSVGGPRPVMIR